ncbi:MAG TPA: hypothetical protein VFI65_20960 [Streptosporangiaceae bacterium]|nr:hypothetical protein [Streptosporangiaceae bacterium]
MAYDYNDYNAAEHDPAVGNPATPITGAAIPAGLAEPFDSSELVDPAEHEDLAEPAGSAEPASPDIRVVTAAGQKPSLSAVPATSSADLASDLNSDEEHWHDIVAGFIDDPRGSVAEAAELVEADVTALIALLSRRRDAMGDGWQKERSGDSGGATEELRLALRDYRDFSRQITTSRKALN